MATDGSRGLGFEFGVRTISWAGTAAATPTYCIGSKLPATRRESLSGDLQRFGLGLTEYSHASRTVCATYGCSSSRTCLFFSCCLHQTTV